MDTIEVSAGVHALQRKLMFDHSTAAIGKMNELIASGYPAPVAVTLVCRAHIAAAASAYATACTALGAEIDHADLREMMEGVIASPAVGSDVAEALVERDLAGTVQQ